MAARFILLFWLTSNTIVTLVSSESPCSSLTHTFFQSKRNSFEELFDYQTFLDVYLAILILGIQIPNFVYYIMVHSTFPSTPHDLHEPDIANQFINLRSVSYRWQLIVLLDTSTVCLCVLSLMTNLRKIKTID